MNTDANDSYSNDRIISIVGTMLVNRNGTIAVNDEVDDGRCYHHSYTYWYIKMRIF